MSDAEKVEVLRKALEGLIGASTVDELHELEAVLRITPAPNSDRADALNAIQALLEVSK